MRDVIRCVIADDEPPARRLLKRLPDQRNDIVVAAEAGTGREAVDAICLARPDVVFLDRIRAGVQIRDRQYERISEIIQPTPRDCYVALENGVRIKVTRGYQSVVDRLMFDLE